MTDLDPRGYHTVFLSVVCACGFRITARSIEALGAAEAHHDWYMDARGDDTQRAVHHPCVRKNAVSEGR